MEGVLPVTILPLPLILRGFDELLIMSIYRCLLVHSFKTRNEDAIICWLGTWTAMEW